MYFSLRKTNSLYRIFILLFAFFLVVSCKNKEIDTNKNTVERPNASVAKTHRVSTTIRTIFKPEIEDWETYRNVDDFINRFKNASANEVLSNALELEDLIKKVKDTVKPRVLMSPALNARINVLYNESLRLSDMTLIPAITAEEVHEQTDKVLKAFSSLNAKINTVLLKKRFEEAIDIDADFIGIDTTKIDSISRKTIRDNQLKRPDRE